MGNALIPRYIALPLAKQSAKWYNALSYIRKLFQKEMRALRRKTMDFSAITRHQEERFAQKTLVGSVSKINIDGKTVWNEAHGMADIENGKKMTKDAMFRLASMSKPITGVAVMQLVESGKAGLHDDISKYIPELKDFSLAGRDENGQIINIGKAKRGIEIFQLLNHTSGLAQSDMGYEQYDRAPFRAHGNDTLKDVVHRYNEILLDNEPGTAMGYGAIAAYDVLSRIVEVISDMSYDEYLKKNITGPLGLNDIVFHPTKEQINRLVAMYTADGTITRYPDVRENMLTMPESFETGAACLLGSVDDYMVFAECLQNEGEFDGVRILKPETVSLMRTPHIAPDVAGYNESCVWGLSMRVITDKNPDTVPPLGTYGWSGAYGTHFIIVPSLKLTAVYASNLTNAGGSGAPTAFEFERDIMDALKNA